MSTATQESRRIVEGYYTALAAGDVPSAMAALAPDVVLEVMGHTPISGRHVGLEALMANAIGPIAGALEMSEAQFAASWEIYAAEGNRVAGRMTATAVTMSGKRYDNSYCQLFRVANGQIAEMYEYLDTVLVEDAIFDNELTQPRGV